MREALARLPVHPPLFATAVPLTLLANNINQVQPAVAIRGIQIAVISALLLWIIARIVSGDWRRAAVFASILIVLFSTYGLAYAFVREAGELGRELARHRYMLPVWLVLLSLGVYGARRLGEHTVALTGVLNIVGASLFLLPLTQISRFEIASTDADQKAVGLVATTSELTFSNERPLPDQSYYSICERLLNLETVPNTGTDCGLPR